MHKNHFQEPLTGMPFILLEAGHFIMGDHFEEGFANEYPLHKVELSAFYLGQYPVTQSVWMQIMGDNPSYFKGENLPVEQVSWLDVQTFIERLNNQSEQTYRLPTEAEWEYAARSGGKKQRWSGTSDPEKINQFAWFDKNADAKTHPVGEKKSNDQGFFDMSGNVCEWTQDVYAEDAYNHHAHKNPCYKVDDEDRVIRGGGWYQYPLLQRCSDRAGHGKSYRDRYIGFRLARNH
ncbi:formylglycine-generating enzyme family protein [Magnetococcales bacterium HHB-1]